MEQVRFYLNGPLDSLTEALAPSPLQFISRQQPNGALACALALNRYKYILASEHSLSEAAPWYPFLNRDFLRSYAERIYVEDVSLFRLKACQPPAYTEKGGVYERTTLTIPEIIF
jgi:hypothetical protein